MDINKKNIPPEYMIPLPENVRYNPLVFDCHSRGCINPKSHRKMDCSVIEDILGFSDTKWGMLVVWQCRYCKVIHCFHLRSHEAVTSFDYVSRYHEYKTTGTYKI